MQQLDTHLVLLQPFLQQLLAPLLEDRPAELQRLKLIELALIQQDSKVLEQRGGLARLGRNALEATDGVWGAQNALDQTHTPLANQPFKHTFKSNQRLEVFTTTAKLNKAA